MNSRNSSSDGVFRLVAGLITVIGAVVAFGIYQSSQSSPARLTTAVTPTVAATRAQAFPIIPPTATPVPVQLRIVAARANLSAIITELFLAKNADNWDLTQLTTFAGHLQGTAVLKQGGNYVVAGHVEMKDGSPGPFAEIGKLVPGDTVSIVSTRPGNPVVMSYIVTRVEVVPPDDFAVLRNHGYEELTMITCTDWSQQDHTYHTRVVVHARPPRGAA